MVFHGFPWFWGGLSGFAQNWHLLPKMNLLLPKEHICCQNLPNICCQSIPIVGICCKIINNCCQKIKCLHKLIGAKSSQLLPKITNCCQKIPFVQERSHFFKKDHICQLLPIIANYSQKMPFVSNCSQNIQFVAICYKKPLKTTQKPSKTNKN